MNKSLPFRFFPVVVSAVLAFGFWMPSALASVIFALGNNPQSGETNILFSTPESGSTLTGEVDHTGIGVDFSSLTGQTLDQNAQGQASITTSSNGGELTSMSVVVPGHFFGDFILDLQNGTGDATVTVVDNLTNSSAFTYTLGNGENYLTITTSGGESIASVAVTLSTDGGFEVFKQPRISQVCNADGCGSQQVPEPQSLALLTCALLGLVLVRQRRRF